MYNVGDLNYGKEMDERADYKTKLCTYLRHSCGSWVIGGRKEIEALIADLRKIMEDNNL